jgi:hypothetical protein
MMSQRKVSSVADLLASVGDASIRQIVATSSLEGAPSFRLSRGQSLVGENGACLCFAPGQDGLELSSDNCIEHLELKTDVDRRAVFNDTTVSGLGALTLRNLRVEGVVQILARDAVKSGHVEAHSIHIKAADARAYGPRPKGYGVEVIPGAFTLWNQQDDPAVALTADLTGLSAGEAGAPVRGSGIFVSGGGDNDGKLLVRRLETGAVHSDGGIASGAPDRITGGVFVVYGAYVDTVCNYGPVTTYGANDMVLDNWGSVDRWVANGRITSLGPSGIGFVNFGVINRLEINEAVETFGRGARGFNVYAGAVKSAEFERVATHGDGAVGVQISQPVGEIKVRHGIETFGGVGDSLVKGVVRTLSAVPLSIKPGGAARRIEIAGGLIAHGKGVVPIEIHGVVEALDVAGGVVAPSDGFDAI